jgi:hypothetical protein
MPTKKEIESTLTSKGVPFESSMKKDELERRLEASQYKPNTMSRTDVEKLTVPILKEILSIHGVSTKGIKNKEGYVNTVIGLNRSVVLEEQHKKEEDTQKFKSIPLDALHLAMKRLSIPEQMKASIAFGDKAMVREMQSKRLDLPNHITIYDDDRSDDVTFEKRLIEYDRQQIKRELNTKLITNYSWTLDNDYISVKRSIIQHYGRGQYLMRYEILSKMSSLKVIVSHDLLPSSNDSKEMITNIKFYISFDTMDKNELIHDMNYIRIGIRWIEMYGGYKVIPKIINKIELNDVPQLIRPDNRDVNPLTRAQYVKLFIKELKRGY